jgi:predicted RNase H-like HicB family nuclease
MRYSVLIEPVEESENMPGMYYAHVPSLGLTTHGSGIEGAMAAARDLIALWVEEKRASGAPLAPVRESFLATVEVE